MEGRRSSEVRSYHIHWQETSTQGRAMYTGTSGSTVILTRQAQLLAFKGQVSSHDSICCLSLASCPWSFQCVNVWSSHTSMVLTTVSHSRTVTLSLAFVTCLFPVLKPQAQFPATCSLFRGYLAKTFSVTRSDNIRSHCLIRISDVFEKCGKCRLDLRVWLPVCDFL